MRQSSQITTHILDTARGCPAEGVHVVLYRVDPAGDTGRDAGRDQVLAKASTDDDGRVGNLLDPATVLEAGAYRLRFEVSGYFRNRGHKQFYPWVDVVFQVDGDGQHYHVPLLLSPYGYSTYRGS